MPFTLRDLGLVTQVVSSPVFFSANSLIKKRPGSDSMIAEILKPWQTAHGDTGHTVLCVDGETEAPSTLPKVIIAITLWGTGHRTAQIPRLVVDRSFSFRPSPEELRGVLIREGKGQRTHWDREREGTGLTLPGRAPPPVPSSGTGTPHQVWTSPKPPPLLSGSTRPTTAAEATDSRPGPAPCAI